MATLQTGVKTEYQGRFIMLPFGVVKEVNAHYGSRIYPGQIGTVCGVVSWKGDPLLLVRWGSTHKGDLHRISPDDVVWVATDARGMPEHFNIGVHTGHRKVKVHAGSRCFMPGSTVGTVLAIAKDPGGDARKDEVLVKFWGFVDELTYRRWELAPVLD